MFTATESLLPADKRNTGTGLSFQGLCRVKYMPVSA